MQGRRRKRRNLWVPVAHFVLILGGITMLLPLVWMLSTSLKSEADVMSAPPDFIPRSQELWKNPATGLEYHIFNVITHDRPLRVARLATMPDKARVVVLYSDGKVGKPEDWRTSGGPKLVPSKHINPRWDNYPKAFNALTLQRNWLAWDLPYQLNLGFVKLGPLHSAGLPLRNAFIAFYLNSLIVTIAVTVGGVVTSSLAAFAFSRLSFPGRDKLFLAYLGTMMVPQVVTMIPVFVLLKMIGLIDSYWAMILPPMFTAYGTFLLRQFFVSIPTELEDAARIDGCGLWGIYRHVIMPLSGPALATLTTFIFLGTWNSFMWPLIVINSMEKRPLMLGLYAFMSQYNTEWALLMAASVMVMGPVVVVFLIGQRYFVKGIVVSGLK
ncbi:MAG: carbohydrate ABC transporter permease [Armatimonadota bacterium]